MASEREAHVAREFAADGRLVILPEAPDGMPPYAHLEPLVDVLCKRQDLSVPHHRHYFIRTDFDGRGGYVWKCGIGFPIDWAWANKVAQIPETIKFVPRANPSKADAVHYVGRHGEWCVISSMEQADSPKWTRRGWVTGEPFQSPDRGSRGGPRRLGLRRFRARGSADGGD